ncbi:MAG TPA: cation:proton antiporter, partial [Anaerolineales bacterium]|nr:cation:proton antiporter [Anaerolineales bacterium]
EIDFSNLGFSAGKGPAGSAPAGKRRLGPIQLGLASFLITVALSIIIGFLLVGMHLVVNPWMMALILSTTSLGVVVPVLKERGLSTGRYGQTLLVAALIADFATMLLITVEVAAISRGLTPEVLLIGLLFVAFFLAYHFGMFFFHRIPGVRRTMQEMSSATAQIKMRAAFTIMLIFVVLSEILGTEIILGAFLAGAIVALLRRPEDADSMRQLEATGFGFFIPIFFIMVGVDFDFQALLSSSQALLLAPLLFLAALAVKIIPALTFRLAFSWRESLAGGVLLSSRLSLIIAASAIGMRLGVISDAVNAAIILVAILTVTLAPLVFTRLIPGPAAAALQPYIVVGAEPLGLDVAEQIKIHHERVLVMDSDPDRIERARQRNLETLLINGTLFNEAASAELDQAHALVCTYSNVELCYEVCRLARTQFGIDHIIAHVTNPSEILRFQQLGVVAANAALDRAAMLSLLARNPALYQLLTRSEDGKEVVEVEVHNHQYVLRRLREINLPGDVLILAVRRNGELLVPHGETLIERFDHLTLAGSLDSIEEARQAISAPHFTPAAPVA